MDFQVIGSSGRHEAQALRVFVRYWAEGPFFIAWGKGAHFAPAAPGTENITMAQR